MDIVVIIKFVWLVTHISAQCIEYAHQQVQSPTLLINYKTFKAIATVSLFLGIF